MKPIHTSFIGLTLLSTLCLAQGAPGSFTDDFSSYPNKNACIADGSSAGPWTNAFSGYGCVKIATDGVTSWLEEAPGVSKSPSETHASLALGPSFSGPLAYSVNVRTVAQLRQGSAPNPWEVGWVIWNYADNTHFYYFQLKPNGWELGKEDPAYPGAQRFLATGPAPAFPIGAWNRVQIQQNGNAITVSANGQTLTTFTDQERPYLAGRIGAYNEDSNVQFAKVAAGPLAAPATPTAASVPAKPGSSGATPPVASIVAAPVNRPAAIVPAPSAAKLAPAPAPAPKPAAAVVASPKAKR